MAQNARVLHSIQAEQTDLGLGITDTCRLFLLVGSGNSALNRSY